MSPPVELVKQIPKTDKFGIENNDSFGNMEELLLCEQQNVVRMLEITLKVAPNMLGNDTIKTNKAGSFLLTGINFSILLRIIIIISKVCVYLFKF